MIIKFVIGLIIIATLFSVIQKYKKAKPAERKSWLFKGIIAAIIVALVIGVVTGRVPIIAGLIAVIATLARFGLRFGLPLAKMWFAKSGGNATFRSQYLVMTVNVGSGQITGHIIKGQFANQSLGNLSEDDIKTLHNYFNVHDKKSYYLLSAYLRSRGFSNAFSSQPEQESFNTQNDQYNPNNHTANTPSHSSHVSLDEAMDIFGFKEPPTKKEVINAHRRLMSKLHPDKGGSDYLAARVNQAREILLQHGTKPP